MPLKQFQTGRYDTFLGSMYTFTKGYPQSDVLKQHPDYLDYYLPIADTHARYYADGSLENGTPVSVVYTQLDESVSNKYLCFIGGDTPICIVESRLRRRPGRRRPDRHQLPLHDQQQSLRPLPQRIGGGQMSRNRSPCLPPHRGKPLARTVPKPPLPGEVARRSRDGEVAANL